MPNWNARAAPYHLNATLSAVNVGRLLLWADNSLPNLMNAYGAPDQAANLGDDKYRQLSVDGSVDVNRPSSVAYQLWQRSAA